MEPTVFLSGPQHLNTMKVMSWNINGVRTKLEKKNVQDFLRNYDIISLNEVKTSLHVSFPGYVSYKSEVCGSAERGGTVVFIRNCFAEFILDVDTSIQEQVWIRFRFAPNHVFCFCYIPPADSQYYSHDLFAAIQEKLCGDSLRQECIVIGDMNARFGSLARDLPSLVELPESDNFTYPDLPDDVRLPNDNAFILSSVCQASKLVLINNLKTSDKHFLSRKTYRKGEQWVSELDVCIVSSGVVSRVSEFQVFQNDSYLSDHAPIAITLSLPTLDLENLSARAHHLGDHAVLYDACNPNRHVRKPVHYNDIDETTFTNILHEVECPVLCDNINETARNVTELLYQCARASRH